LMGVQGVGKGEEEQEKAEGGTIGLCRAVKQFNSDAKVGMVKLTSRLPKERILGGREVETEGGKWKGY